PPGEPRRASWHEASNHRQHRRAPLKSPANRPMITAMALNPRARVRSGDLPLEVATAALINIAGATASPLRGAVPLCSRGGPVRAELALAAMGGGLAGVLLALGRFTPRWVINVNIVLAVLAGSALVSVSVTPGGELLAGFVFTWVSLYVPLFLPQRAARVHA